MRLCDDPKGYARLFLSVLPEFVKALPRPPSPSVTTGLQHAASRESEALKNSITLLRIEFREMQNTFAESCCSSNLTVDEFNTARDALEDVLYLLEGLADSLIPVHQVNQAKERELPKLHSLSDTVLTCETSISFGPAAARYRLVHSQARQFNETMRRIFDSPTVDTESQTRPFYHEEEATLEGDNLAMGELIQAKRLSDTANALFKLLAEELKSCEPSHSAHIHLSGFSQPEIDMLMSLCGPNGTRNCHGVSWRGRSHNRPSVGNNSPRHGICSTLKRYCKFKKRLLIEISQDGSWSNAESSSGRVKDDATAPTLKLAELLHVRKGTTMSSARLLRKDRLHLAKCITKSSLYLLGGPLSPEAWRMEEIYVTQDHDSQTCSYKPYILQKFTDQMLREPKRGSESLLYLGVLLWELLFGRRVTIMPDDEEYDDEYQDISLFNALSREESELRETCVEKPFLDIIANCLNIYPEVELDDQELRNKVYWEVLNPLLSYVEAYQSSMSTAKVCRMETTWPLFQGYAEEHLDPKAGTPKSSPESSSLPYKHPKKDLYSDRGSCRDYHDVTVESRSSQSLPEESEDEPYNGLGKRKMSQVPMSERSGKSRLEPQKYNIAIVCALPKEHLAVRLLFDEKHRKPDIPSEDSNQYAFGCIGRHNVVTACLPVGNYGTSPAALVIANMKRTFTSIKYYLLVGIGGGIPSKRNDIRLGDVVVSIPEGAFPGVIQYDRGKRLGNDEFEKTGSLPPPPHEILNVISYMQSDPGLPPEPLQSYLKAISDLRPEYGHPGMEDNKFLQGNGLPVVDESHTSELTNSQRINARDHPKIHYGLIASGDLVIKNAEFRDRLSQRYNVLCVEMEAAGIANVASCLVIRGICDYADSSKSKVWQEYASAAAASYAKLLLFYL
ncbi:purine and uridine phosphorylase [Aspergillus campestris IBT 28561]|uniref:Purine and uridine phosphorylase n=1 Tax=Aspergillus campestris (strain IBT 28561) TaxID=1392248 RepID=A0A2I1DH95_ASPC2|nr:purine and uridine phosphorylase [Aspergillus campestris IBT 28561]PKY09243.1 purine and uridine phosphorylase [Aspergillus campestris IBT 28561]